MFTSRRMYDLSKIMNILLYITTFVHVYVSVFKLIEYIYASIFIIKEYVNYYNMLSIFISILLPNNYFA